MTSSPCSSPSATFMSAFQTQQLFTNQYPANNRVVVDDDEENENSACSSKENYVPANYYLESTSTNVNLGNDYNAIYTNPSIQSTDQFSYPSMSLSRYS